MMELLELQMNYYKFLDLSPHIIQKNEFPIIRKQHFIEGGFDSPAPLKK